MFWIQFPQLAFQTVDYKHMPWTESIKQNHVFIEEKTKRIVDSTPLTGISKN